MGSLLSVAGLTKSYRQSAISRKPVTAIGDVGFEIERSECVGLVGRSGSGKSTTARCVLQLVRPDSGSIRFEGRDLCELRGRGLRQARLGMQAVFQNPTGSFDPRHTLARSVAEPLRRTMREDEAESRVEEVLDLVGLSGHGDRKPDQLSGGQVQRAAIARAIAPRPKLIVLDEATSALDLSIQAQVLNLLRDLQRSTGVAMLVISHDFGVVNVLCQRLLIMEQGRIIEQGRTRETLDRPRSQIGRRLLEASLKVEPPTREE